jgi:hypothetical protein
MKQSGVDDVVYDTNYKLRVHSSGHRHTKEGKKRKEGKAYIFFVHTVEVGIVNNITYRVIARRNIHIHYRTVHIQLLAHKRRDGVLFYLSFPSLSLSPLLLHPTIRRPLLH